MKSIRFAAAFAAVAMFRLAAAQPAASDLKVDDVIAKAVQAQGGLEKLKAVKSVKITGKMVLGGGQMEAPMITYVKRPRSTRTELAVQGQQIIEAFDGTTKWSVNPMMGSKDPQKSNEDETKAAADDADVVEGPLVNYKEKGHTVELLGKEDVEGSMAYKLKVTMKSGRIQTLYLDEKTFLVVKMVTKIKQMGQEFEAEILPGNYKPEEGVMMAHSTDMKINGQIGMQMQFDKIEINVPLDDAMFVMPEAKKVDPPKAQ